MSVNSKIATDILKFAVGQIVTLFELDLTDLGGSTIRWAPTTYKNDPGDFTTITFNTYTYYARAATLKGFGVSGKEKQIRPSIQVDNLDGYISDLCRTYDDCVGALLRRRRTLKKYLDGEPDADTNAQFPVDVYRVAKKRMQNKFVVEFELEAYMNLTGRKIPNRVILKDPCPFVYRYYSGGSFVYPDISGTQLCPYTGSDYYKQDGTSTSNSSEDECGKRLSDCKLRFGTYGPLPFGAFPGVERYEDTTV